MSRLADINVAIQEWVVSTLTASQPLADALGVPLASLGSRLWDSMPGPEAAMPYVDIRVVEPRDIGAVGLVTIMARAEVTVKVVGQAESYEPIRAAAVAIYSALQGKKSVPLNGSGLVLSSDRLRAIAYPEVTAGIEYRHLGGTYEVFAQ